MRPERTDCIEVTLRGKVPPFVLGSMVAEVVRYRYDRRVSREHESYDKTWFARVTRITSEIGGSDGR